MADCRVDGAAGYYFKEHYAIYEIYRVGVVKGTAKGN